MDFRVKIVINENSLSMVVARGSSRKDDDNKKFGYKVSAKRFYSHSYSNIFLRMENT